MLQALLGPIGNIATTFLKNRAEKAKAKQKLEVAKMLWQYFLLAQVMLEAY